MKHWCMSYYVLMFLTELSSEWYTSNSLQNGDVVRAIHVKVIKTQRFLDCKSLSGG